MFVRTASFLRGRALLRYELGAAQDQLTCCCLRVSANLSLAMSVQKDLKMVARLARTILEAVKLSKDRSRKTVSADDSMRIKSLV